MAITSYHILQSKIEAFCDNHYQIKKFGGEFYSEINNFATEDEKFPIIFSSPIAQRVSDNVIQFDMDIYCLDIIKNDRSNINTILSDTNLILNDLHLFFKLGEDVSVDVIGEPSLTPINNSLMDYAAGWVMRITFEVDNYGPCQIPFIDAPLIPVEQGGNIFFQYLTCETLASCDTFENLVASAETLNTEVQEIQNDIIELSGDTITGFTYNDANKFSISTRDGNTFNSTIDIVTGLTTNYIQYNTGATETSAVGKLKWNDIDGTLDLGLKGGNVTLQIGQEQVIRVVNKTGANLLESEYKVVRIRTQAEGGAQGQRLAVKLAQANTKENHKGILGVVTETIQNNQEGFITTFGAVKKINTTGSLQGETWIDGDTLWLSETNAGGLTNIEPTNHPVQIGYVEYAHQNNGKIFVRVEDGVDELSELHDVNISSGTTGGSTIEYDSSTGRWVNSPINWTIELVDAQTVDVYAPYNLKINTVSNVLNSPTITILDDGASYILGNTISIGSKISISASTSSVINLNIEK